MLAVQQIGNQNSSKDLLNNRLDNNCKDDNNIFASCARKAGLDGFANFLSDDWSAKTARKAGFDNFANWLENKDENGNVKDDKGGFFENLAREVVKHPVATIATITATIFAGRLIYRAVSKNAVKQAAQAPVTSIAAAPTATHVAKVTVPTSYVDKIAHLPYDEQVKLLKQKMWEGVGNERKLNYKNLEIFDGVPENKRRSIVSYFSVGQCEDELLMFATGSKPGMMVSGPGALNIFETLEKTSVNVANLFSTDSYLITNIKSAKKIIGENKAFFIQRLGLPATTSIDDIYAVVAKDCNNPLSKIYEFSDIKALLQGATRKNAIYSQIRQDIWKYEHGKMFDPTYKTFYSATKSGTEALKNSLKKWLNSDKSSYKDMPKEFIDEATKMIDSITMSEHSRRVEMVDLFIDKTFKDEQLKALRNLVRKLEEAEKQAKTIGIS